MYIFDFFIVAAVLQISGSELIRRHGVVEMYDGFPMWGELSTLPSAGERDLIEKLSKDKLVVANGVISTCGPGCERPGQPRGALGLGVQEGRDSRRQDRAQRLLRTTRLKYRVEYNKDKCIMTNQLHDQIVSSNNDSNKNIAKHTYVVIIPAPAIRPVRVELDFMDPIIERFFAPSRSDQKVDMLWRVGKALSAFILTDSIPFNEKAALNNGAGRRMVIYHMDKIMVNEVAPDVSHIDNYAIPALNAMLADFVTSHEVIVGVPGGHRDRSGLCFLSHIDSDMSICKVAVLPTAMMGRARKRMKLEEGEVPSSDDDCIIVDAHVKKRRESPKVAQDHGHHLSTSKPNAASSWLTLFFRFLLPAVKYTIFTTRSSTGTTSSSQSMSIGSRTRVSSTTSTSGRTPLMENPKTVNNAVLGIRNVICNALGCSYASSVAEFEACTIRAGFDKYFNHIETRRTAYKIFKILSPDFLRGHLGEHDVGHEHGLRSDESSFEGGHVLNPVAGCYKGVIVINGNSLQSSITSKLWISIDRFISSLTLQGISEKFAFPKSELPDEVVDDVLEYKGRIYIRDGSEYMCIKDRGRSDVASGYKFLTVSAFRATGSSHRIISPKTCAKIVTYCARYYLGLMIRSSNELQREELHGEGIDSDREDQEHSKGTPFEEVGADAKGNYKSIVVSRKKNCDAVLRDDSMETKALGIVKKDIIPVTKYGLSRAMEIRNSDLTEADRVEKLVTLVGSLMACIR
ncbi:hypothetical protein FACUT_13019 [Fusarium acutatum]|uniref:Uncharacterized protein n=1 Tax=Fusarium acutatum TaxID=78861 RepID=A0A8H4JCK2_9HYPO|nr:hypothetical protein FACUT_13019 [Fusarium acutatum]